MGATVDTGEGTSEHLSRLEELYVRYLPEAVSLGYLLSGDRDQARDLAQEAFVRLCGRFGHLRDPRAFGAYLRRIVVNLHVSRLRRLRVERAFVERQGSLRDPPAAAIPDVALREDLWAAVHRLPARQRAALVLRFYQDLSERETADTLGCSVAAVRSLVARGMQSLRADVRGAEG